MIEIRYQRVLFFQAVFLFSIGIFTLLFFKDQFNLKLSSLFWVSYLLVLAFFIGLNLVFINFYALPTKKLLSQLKNSLTVDDLSWSDVEEIVSKRDIDLKLLQSEYENENLKYKMLLDSLHDPVCILNKNEIILYSNHAFNKLFSLPEDTKKAPLLEVTRNHYFQDFIKNALASNESLKLNEFSFNPIQDSFKNFYEIKVFPLSNIQNYLCIMHDVTERKMADQMREEFVSNFSHEVRTPLTILSGQMYTLKSEIENDKNYHDKFKTIFDKIDNNSRRLINLFNDLLRLTSIQNKKDISKELVPVEMIILGIYEEISQAYPTKKVDIEYDLKLSHFFVDYGLFEQVIINLIDNAFKYAGVNGHILIKTFQEANHQILEISDNGIGIPEDQLHRVFERFFRVNSSRSSEIQGTGLGLAIVKHIVQKHDGKIKVTSRAGNGTTFTIQFPNLN